MDYDVHLCLLASAIISSKNFITDGEGIAEILTQTVMDVFNNNRNGNKRNGHVCTN